jgi:hypothetical protein
MQVKKRPSWPSLAAVSADNACSTCQGVARSSQVSVLRKERAWRPAELRGSALCSRC